MRRLALPLGLLALIGFACSTETKYVAQPPAAATPDAGTTPTGDDDGSAGDDDDSTTADAGQVGGFPAKWIDGTTCSTEEEIQTWQHAKGLFILRQSLCTSFEAPFMYLLVGKSKALLIDSGAGGIELRPKVRELLASAGVPDIELVVAHSHSHGDHVAGDSEFKGKTKTTVVGLTATAVKTFFAINGDAAGSFDLGDRVIDVIPIPGHEAAHVAYFDRASKVLLTGDTLYPGRLYVDDWAAYRKSIPRLVAFVDDGHTPSAVLGAHIELRKTPTTTPDFALGSMKHPDEHVLQLATADLRKLDEVVKSQGDSPAKQVEANFILDP